jgi:hypothetical protein
MNDKRKKPKSFRIQVLLDVLERWGRLDKNAICSKVAQSIDENADSESFQRAIYRDLEDLVTDAKIAVEYFTRDGALIEDYDSDVHKNVSCQWFIPSAEGKISGSGKLESLNSLIYVPKILKNDLSIIDGKIEANPRHLHLYFQIGANFLCLKISFEALPISILFSRIHGEITYKEIEEIKNKMGLRTIILKIPFASLSSFKTNTQAGHALFKINNENEIEITDYNSSNGSRIYKLTTSEADRIREKASRLDDMTMTSTWKEIDPNLVKPSEVKGTLKFKSPTLVEIGDNFKILVV